MKQYNNKPSLAFEDILLVPQHSDIVSRKDIRLSSSIGQQLRSISLRTPIIAAPMDTVCEWEMAVAMKENGGIGIIHRYMPIEKQITMIKMARANNAIAAGSVGAKDEYLSDAIRLVEAGAKIVLVDTANGHSQYAIDAVKNLRRVFGYEYHIMAGNVSTADGFAALQDAGADSIRVGIGGGSACTTRIVSGHGIPTLQSIIDIRERFPYGSGASIIADGGIRNSGDAAKALAAGANAVMLGGALAGTDESPGDVVDGYKLFRGMASKEAQQDGRGSVSGVEGIATTVPYRGSVNNIINDFRNGIASAMSYTGVDNLQDFATESMYTIITNSGIAESKPHAKVG
jgi:IMP dehydrogenase